MGEERRGGGAPGTAMRSSLHLTVSMHRRGGGRGVGVVVGSIEVRQLGLLTLRKKEVRVFLS